MALLVEKGTRRLVTSTRRIAAAPADLEGAVHGLYVLAQSDDWSLREEAGFSLRNLIEQHFEPGMLLSEAWPTDPSNFVRRAACLACMQRKAYTDEARVSSVLKRLATLMADDDLYVRKCCGPFVVGYLGYTYPKVSLPWLSTMARSENLNIRANVAKAFSQALGRQQANAGLDLLSVLSDDTHHRVRSAVRSSLRNILRGLGNQAPTRLKSFPALQELAAELMEA